MAVGDSDQQVAFTAGRGAGNRVAETGGIDCQSVQQMRIDSVIGDAWPIFAKLDIEEGEEQALRGEKKLIKASPSNFFGNSKSVVSQRSFRTWIWENVL
jgi:hypothetical protein